MFSILSARPVASREAHDEAPDNIAGGFEQVDDQAPGRHSTAILAVPNPMDLPLTPSCLRAR
jgi:hypothetical protein